MTLQPISVTRRAQLWSYLRPLEKQGYSSDQLLDLHGLSRWKDGAPLDWVPTKVVTSALDLAALTTGDTHYGFTVAKSFSPVALPVVGPYIGRAATAYESLRSLSNLAGYHTPSVRIWLEEDEKDIWLCAVNPLVRSQMIDQYTIEMLVKIVRLSLGPVWRPKYIKIYGDEAEMYESNNTFSDAVIMREQKFLAVALPKASLPAILPEPGMSIVAEDQTRNLGRKLTEDPFNILLELLETNLIPGALTVQDAAELLGISSRTLKRQLAENGTSFRRLLNQGRYRKAIELLEHHDIPIKEISRDLGYANVQAFYHAFRRMAGMTPMEYRHEVLAQQTNKRDGRLEN